jgi:hypothetical protein
MQAHEGAAIIESDSKSHWYWTSYLTSCFDSVEMFSADDGSIGVKGGHGGDSVGERLVWLRGATAVACLRDAGDRTWTFAGFVYLPGWRRMLRKWNGPHEEVFVLR